MWLTRLSGTCLKFFHHALKALKQILDHLQLNQVLMAGSLMRPTV